MDIGIGTRPKHGQLENGDGYFVGERAGEILLSVIDGIGHGEVAGGISAKATAFLANHPNQEPAALIRGCHQELRGSRGAVMALAVINRTAQELTYAGVGNIRARIIRKTSAVESIENANGRHTSQHMTSMNGIVGFNLGVVKAFRYPCHAGDTVVMFSDGISSRMDVSQFLPAQDLQDAAERILEAHGKDDDATILLARL